jgi:Protein CHAPERONE-LIKE PROTEIN OF POR1-like
MSEQNPYEKLGVTENASFEEIQEAKQGFQQKYQNDPQMLEDIESAYDAIIMERLRMRQEGKIKVPERIRFPEKTTEVSANPVTPLANIQSPTWLQRLIDTPSRGDIIASTAVFLTLGVLTFVTQSISVSLLSLLMAVGFSANLYFINRKEQRFGRAFLFSFVGLLLGVGVGTLLAGLLASPSNLNVIDSQQLASLVTFCFFWLISSFLR